MQLTRRRKGSPDVGSDRPGPSSRRSDLKWEIIPATETDRHPSGVSELVDRTRDGVTITGVASPGEIEAGLRNLASVEKVETPFGSLLGMSLGGVGPDEPDRSRYYDDTERCRAIYRDAFGFDLHERIAAAMQPMAPGTPLVPPTEDGRAYNPAQIRWWEPNRGGLPAHVGNEFRRELEDGAMSHLVTVTQVTHHLSYFMILQQAEVGGALSVYDLLWEEYDTHDVAWQNCQRDDSYFESVPCTKIDPQPGDLVVFGGGWRWHRVDPPLGPKARISYGGFCAPSVDGTELHFWA